MLNGSPHQNGNTAIALDQMKGVFESEGIQVEIIQVGSLNVRSCTDCKACAKTGKCVIDDVVNEAAKSFETADGLVLASPVYYASANAALVAFVTRLMRVSRFSKAMKVGASVVVARRGGLSSTFDELNKFFTISSMPVASSTYWNSVHGSVAPEALEDKEGLWVVRTLAKNMSFLMKSIALGKEAYGLPQIEPRETTNFIR